MRAVATDLRSLIASRIDAVDRTLASRWFAGLESLVPVAPDDIFPGEQLLGHVPSLIRELAAFLRAPAQDTIAANAVVTARATELGRLRHAQHASVHQVLREYRMLRTVIAGYIEEEIAGLRVAPTPETVIDLMNRLEEAVDVLLQTTIDTYIAEYTEAITRHTSQLEGFNRMVTHELRQPLGTLQFAVKRLAMAGVWADPPTRDQILATVERNVTRIGDTLSKLIELSRSGNGTESALVQRIELTALANDIITQVREMADARRVEVRVATPLPAVTIDVARLELMLVNLISNAIKYSDPNKPQRVVEIGAVASERSGICTITVRDNGIGIAEADLHSIFGRFYRGHASRDRELGTSGLGLGLAIVADCADALKGDIRVESQLGEGTMFFLELPTVAEG